MASCATTPYDSLKQAVLAVARRACASGLQVGSGGNISMRVPGQEQFIIKPSGRGFMALDVASLLITDFEGKVVVGSGKPSKDTMSHAHIYRLRPEVQGILHVHATWALLFAMQQRTIPLVTEEAIEKLGKIPVIPCAAGKLSQDHQQVGEAFADTSVKVALLAKHGLIAAGHTLDEAVELCELANESAKLAFLLQLGGAAVLPNGEAS